jgi:hypothetical protein
VRGLQQFVMAEPADGAALLVGAEHALAKAQAGAGAAGPPRSRIAAAIEPPRGSRSRRRQRRGP